MRGRIAIIRVLAALLVIGTTVPAHADDEKRLRDQLREEHRRALSLAAQLADSAAQNETLQQQLADEKAHSDTLRQQAEQETVKNQALQHQMADQKSQFDSQQAAAEKLLDKWRGSYESLVQQAKKIDGERRDYFQKAQSFQARSEQEEKQIASCTVKNKALVGIGNDLINLYKNKGIGDVLADNEPFLQLSRAKMENLMQDYGDKIYDQKVGVAPAPAGLGGAAGGGSAAK
jgi:chromosome segregation ATPase